MLNAETFASNARAAGYEESEIATAIKNIGCNKLGTKFDQPDIGLIFQPLLDRIDAAAAKLDTKIKGRIVLGTSTDVSPSPFARPSGDDHLLFVGVGTAKFCNSWAKAITATAFALRGKNGEIMQPSVQKIKQLAAQNPKTISLAFYLVCFYGKNGSLVGVEEEVQPKAFLEHRSRLLDAMELFVMGHEYAHFFAHEHWAETSGSLSPEQSIELELFCDSLGLRLSRKADLGKNPLTFCGVGAIVFLRAIQVSNEARAIIGTCRAEAELSQSHPLVEDRIKAIYADIKSTTPPQLVEPILKFLESYDALATSMNAVLLEFLRAHQKNIQQPNDAASLGSWFSIIKSKLQKLGRGMIRASR